MSVWSQDRCGVSPRGNESRGRVVEPAIHETGEEAVENRGGRAVIRVSERFHALVAAQVTLAVVGSAIGSPPAYAASCALPAALRVAVEERGSVAAGVALVASAPSCCGLRAGDIVRQANGTRVSRCADLEPVAAEALARGLALLLAVERDGELIAVAAMTRESEQRVLAGASERAPADRALTAPAAGGGAATGVPEHADAKRAATAPGAERAVSATEGPSSTTERAAATARVPEPRPTPRPRRAATLPARAEAPPELRQRAAAAASALARVDDAAAPGVPLVVYERRLGDAEAAIAALEFGVAAADAAVHDFIEDAVALHRTARDVRRTQLQMLGQAEVDRRGSSAGTVPYFSDSKVPDWVAAYPFLADAILEPPHETHAPFPGEASGRWSAERALELLWQRARAASSELATWSRS